MALPPCLVGMEACASAHYWARELTKLSHEVRLMLAKDVKAYIKRNKNDAADAEAICRRFAGRTKISTVPSAPGFPQLREACLASSRGGAVHPHPAVCRRKALPVRRVRPLAQGQPIDVTLLSSMGNNSPPYVASSPCGVCIVARCPFCVGEEREPRVFSVRR